MQLGKKMVQSGKKMVQSGKNETCDSRPGAPEGPGRKEVQPSSRCSWGTVKEYERPSTRCSWGTGEKKMHSP